MPDGERTNREVVPDPEEVVFLGDAVGEADAPLHRPRPLRAKLRRLVRLVLTLFLAGLLVSAGFAVVLLVDGFDGAMKLTRIGNSQHPVAMLMIALQRNPKLTRNRPSRLRPRNLQQWRARGLEPPNRSGSTATTKRSSRRVSNPCGPTPTAPWRFTFAAVRPQDSAGGVMRWKTIDAQP